MESKNLRNGILLFCAPSENIKEGGEGQHGALYMKGLICVFSIPFAS